MSILETIKQKETEALQAIESLHASIDYPAAKKAMESLGFKEGAKAEVFGRDGQAQKLQVSYVSFSVEDGHFKIEVIGRRINKDGTLNKGLHSGCIEREFSIEEISNPEFIRVIGE